MKNIFERLFSEHWKIYCIIDTKTKGVEKLEYVGLHVYIYMDVFFLYKRLKISQIW